MKEEKKEGHGTENRKKEYEREEKRRRRKEKRRKKMKVKNEMREKKKHSKKEYDEWEGQRSRWKGPGGVHSGIRAIETEEYKGGRVRGK